MYLPITTALTPLFAPTLNGDAPGPALASLLGLELSVGVLSFGTAMLSWNLLESRALTLKERWAPYARSPRGQAVWTTASML